MRKSIGVIGKIISLKGMKRNSSIILVFLISFFVVFSNYNIAHADTGQLIVDGSVGTGGLGSVPAEVFPAGLLFTLGLKALDIEINLSNESLQNGKTYTEYCTEQIANWVNQNVITWDDINNKINAGLKYASDGYIYFGNEVSTLIKDFGNWVVSNTGLNFVESGSLSSGDSVTVGTFSTIYTNYYKYRSNRSGSQYFENFITTGPVAVVRYSSYGVLFISKSPFIGYAIDQAGNTTNLSSVSYGDWQYVSRGSDYGSVSASDSEVYHSNLTTPTAVLDSFNNVFDIPVTDVDSDSFVGDSQEWSDHIGALDLPEGYMGAIDPGILSDIQGELDQSKDYVLALEDYIKALEDAINETEADVPVELVDDGTIVLVPDPPIVVEPEYEKVQPTDVPEDLTPVADPSIPAEPDELIQASKVTGLTEVFPFCIPFDLYRLFQKFKAEPVAPRIQIHWQVPGLNTYIDLDLDFSVFNNVATVLRTMELVAAVVGLALVTRRIFLRS